MKQFAFISTNSIQQCYKFLLNKQRTHKYFLDVLKISWLLSFLLLCWFFYLRFVSLASTEWYFLRQANNELTSVHFQYEIVKTELLNKTQGNREKMYRNNQAKKIVDVRPEIVKIPNKTELTYR
jgi:hypothetical protein